MTESISLDLSFDYVNRKYKTAVRLYATDTNPTLAVSYPIVGTNGIISETNRHKLLSGVETSSSQLSEDVPYVISNSEGLIMSAGHLPSAGKYLNISVGRDEQDFGYTNQGGYGINRGLNSGVFWSSNPYVNYRPDYSLDPADISSYPSYSGNITTRLVSVNSPLSKYDFDYSGIPLQLVRGEGCLYGTVSAQLNNRVTWSNSTPIASHTDVDFTDALVSSLSGSSQGQTFRVLDYDNSNNYLYLDKSGSLESNIIRVAPRTMITGYRAWRDNTTDAASAFYTEDLITPGIGNSSGTLVNNGDQNFELGFGSTNIFCTSITIPKDPHMRDPEFGDLVEYTDNGSNANTGMVVSVTEVGGQYTLFYFPRQDAHPTLTEYTLVRTSRYNVELYPNFGEQYTVVSHGSTTYPWYGETRATVPSAELDIVGGDYDSVFGTSDDHSHFHIGPVHLGDGTKLTDSNILLSGELYNNNPTTSTPLTTWRRWTSADSNIASIHTGIYSKFGALVGTYSQAFTTPDMLTLEAEARIGSAVVKKTINFPVQPPV